MATFNKCPSGWRVRVRKAGQTHTATLPTKAAAQQWATQVEADILAGKLGNIPDKTFKDLVDRYLKEVTPTKRGERPERHRLNRTIDDDLGKVRLPQLGPEHFSAWRDRRLRSVSAASVLREWATLAHVCNVAVKEWRWLRVNPMVGIKKPPQPAPRQRIIAPAEIDAVLHACGVDYSTAQGRVGAAFEFALETAMRAGEICGLTWEHVHPKHVHLPKTKNGDTRDVPLSSRAQEIVKLMPKDGDTVFGLRSSILDALFRKAKARALVEGFTFHDSRANALTRLSKKLNVMQLARVSGHRDLRILQRVYYRVAVDDIADIINGPV